MAARSIASLSLTFGLVSIPVKVYSATESAAAVKFKLMGAGGARLRQQYVAEALPDSAPAPVAPALAVEETVKPRAAAEKVIDFPTARQSTRASPEPVAEEPESSIVERSEMVKGYEFEKDRFVLFTPEELKALEVGARHTIDIVSFIPESAVDPIYYDKAYFLAPDKRGGKPYSLLRKAMKTSGRCALAKWAWRSKEYVVQIRPAEGGLVLQQLLYAEEVRSLEALDIDMVEVGDAELKLAMQLIDQISAETYDPTQYKDEEKARILAAVDEKIAGHEIVAPAEPAVSSGTSGQVVDLMAALRASLGARNPEPAPIAPTVVEPAERKPAKRSAKTTAAAKPRKTGTQ